MVPETAGVRDVEFPHTVKSGENLSVLAARYGLSSWKAIYDAPANESLRRKRPHPSHIEPGDVVIIPPDALTIARRRVATLQRLKKESAQYYAGLRAQLEAHFRTAKNWGDGVDLAAMIAGQFLSLHDLCKRGAAVLSKEGAELAIENKKLLRTFAGDWIKSKLELVGGFMTITGEESVAWAIPKILLKSWADMTTPSYWAARVVGRTPQEIHDEAVEQLERSRVEALLRLDERIREAESLVSRIQRTSLMPLP